MPKLTRRPRTPLPLERFAFQAALAEFGTKPMSVGWSEYAGSSLFRQGPQRWEDSGSTRIIVARCTPTGHGTTAGNICSVTHGHGPVRHRLNLQYRHRRV